jgi:hypothetical protein
MELILKIIKDKTRSKPVLLLIFYAVGIAGIWLAPEQFSMLTPFNLFISATILF